MKNNTPRHKQYYIEHTCTGCGKMRRIYAYRANQSTFTGLCSTCNARRRNLKGSNHPRWKGGISKTRGYIEVSVSQNSPYYPMATTHGRIREHRLVVAQYLKRCLKTNEIVHHLNGVRGDNYIGNLSLTTRNKHEHRTLVRALQERILRLEGELLRRGKNENIA